MGIINGICAVAAGLTSTTELIKKLPLQTTFHRKQDNFHSPTHFPIPGEKYGSEALYIYYISYRLFIARERERREIS
jgi:hypothetical protein